MGLAVSSIAGAGQIGDIVGDAVPLNNGSNLDFQPAAGVRVIVTAVGLGVATSVQLSVFDGTETGHITSGDTANGGTVFMPIDNAIRLRISNNSGGAGEYGFSGYEVL